MLIKHYLPICKYCSELLMAWVGEGLSRHLSVLYCLNCKNHYFSVEDEWAE